MQIIESASGLLSETQRYRRGGKTIGLVPTMGYLHRGHLSLVEYLRPKVDILITSIFVNPTQFGPSEDLDSYPRDATGDLNKLRAAGVDIAFTPELADMYPERGEVTVTPPTLATRLCGASRPTHFAGVCTVVLKLFGLSNCTDAIFGEKDYQQLQVLRAMNRQFFLGINIHGGPIVREPTGLAMSSRNAYLSTRERELALCLSRALREAQQLFEESRKRKEHLSVERLRTHVLSGLPLSEVGVALDYLDIVDPTTLDPAETLNADTRVILALHVGKTRLIDNAALID